MIERIPIESRDQWLALRRQDITASTAGALLGLHPYVSAWSLWAEKTGLVASDLPPSPAMERGLYLEPVAIRRLQKLYPDWNVTEPAAYYRDPEARLGATPDCIASDAERGLGVIQIKSVEPSAFRDHWFEDGELRPPLWIAVQAIIEAHLVEASWAAVAALVVGHGLDLHVIDVPIHPGIIEKVKAETRKFWEMVKDGDEPAPDYGKDAALIEQLFARPEEIEIDLSEDNHLPALVRLDRDLADTLSTVAKRRKEIRAEILHKLGSASAARIATGRITAKSVKRKAYVVPESNSRTIRFKEDPV